MAYNGARTVYFLVTLAGAKVSQRSFYSATVRLGMDRLRLLPNHFDEVSISTL